MFSIDPEGRIKTNDRYRGTVWAPGKTHPDALELIERWKAMSKLAQAVDPNLFQVTAGIDYDEVSARIRFAVPHESWKTANRVDKDVRQLWNDLVDMGWTSTQLDAEFAWDEPVDSTWTLSFVAMGDSKIFDFEPAMQYAAKAVRSTRLEEYLVDSSKP